MPIDPSGIYMYAASDIFTDWVSTLNTGQSSVRNVIQDVRTRLTYAVADDNAMTARKDQLAAMGVVGTTTTPLIFYNKKKDRNFLWDGAAFTEMSKYKFQDNYRFLTNAVGATTLKEKETKVLVSLLFSTTQPALLLTTGSVQIRPTGNAAGLVYFTLDGVQIGTNTAYHSQGTANQQNLYHVVSAPLPAGSHILYFTGQAGEGSHDAVFDLKRIQAFIINER